MYAFAYFAALRLGRGKMTCGVGRVGSRTAQGEACRHQPVLVLVPTSAMILFIRSTTCLGRPNGFIFLPA